jgi:hypothetical protein
LVDAKSRQHDADFISALRGFDQLAEDSDGERTDWQVTQSVILRFRTPWLDLLLLLMLTTGELKQSNAIALEDSDVDALDAATMSVLEIVRAGERATRRGTRHILNLDSLTPALAN